MTKLCDFRFVLSVLISGMVLIWTTPARALKTDQNQPTKLTSDKAEFNDVNQEYILTGHVVITKGSIKVKGSKAVVVVDPEGYQRISVVGDELNLASFTQQLDKPTPEFMDGEGDLIFYEAKNDQLLISGHAYTVRRQGSQWKDKLVADEIQYDLFTEEYRALSKTKQNSTRSILAPREIISPALTNAPLK
jgi:lipopolysaccharide export system protein LptA